MLKILIYLGLFLLVDSHQTIKWTANFGKQYPGITPLFSRMNNSIAITSIFQDSNRIFHLLVKQYSIYGQVEAKCDLIIPMVSKRIWDLKVQHGTTSLAITWLYSDGMELGIRILEVNVARCSLEDTRLRLYGDLDLVLYVPYYMVAREDGGFFLFVKTPEICEGICRLNIGKSRPFGGFDGTFITAKDDTLIWRLIAVNFEDLSQGYYYISEDSKTRHSIKIEKLNSSGTLLRSKLLSEQQQQQQQQDHQSDDSNNIKVSNSHARLSMCWSNNCFLLDPNTFQLRKLNVSVTGNISAIANTIDSLLVIYDDNKVMKVQVDDKNNEEQGSIELFRGFNELNCYPRKMYEGFEVENNLYCTGRPCMSKANASEVFYQVSVLVECFQMSV